MPYTKLEDRAKFEPELKNLRERMKRTQELTKGDFTYIAYALGLGYIKRHGESYTNISSAISSLIDAAEELRRRKLNPYEDKKIKENSDIE